eukprot:g28604.t1
MLPPQKARGRPTALHILNSVSCAGSNEKPCFKPSYGTTWTLAYHQLKIVIPGNVDKCTTAKIPQVPMRWMLTQPLKLNLRNVRADLRSRNNVWSATPFWAAPSML